MAAPSSPYSTAEQVSYLLQNRFYGSTPGAGTVPSKPVLEMLVTWTDAVIESQFRSVGYKIPWVELTGETWPAQQTVMLQFMSVIGTAAMAGGHIFRPAPVMGRGAGSSQGNVYADNFTRMINQITKNGYRFRSQYYEGMPAEKWLAAPYGPRMDFLEDYVDPTRFMLLRAYTSELDGVFGDMQRLQIDWDYMYSLRASTAN